MSVLQREILYFEGLIEKYDIRNVLVYSRKSRDDKDKDVLSKHRRSLTKVIEFFNFNTKNEHWFEEVDSSENDERKELKKLENFIDENHKKIDAILVHDIDRLGRNLAMGAFYEKLELYGIKILSFTDDMIYDLSDDHHMTMFMIKNLIANIEIRKNKARNKRARIDAFENGEWMGGKPFFPYEFDEISKGLKFSEENKNIYFQIIDMFLSGISYEAIANWLTDEMFIPSPRDKRWTGKPIKSMLISEQHLGLLIRKGKGSVTKRTYTELPKSEWRIEKGKWESLKTEELHEKICKEVVKRGMQSKKGKNQTHSLSNLLICEKCGRNLRVFKNSNNDELRTRACEDKTNKIKCGNKGGKIGIIENASIEILERMLDDMESSGINPSLLHKIEQRKKKIESNLKLIEQHNDNAEKKLYTIVNDGKYLREEDKERLSKERFESLNEIDFLIQQNKIYENEIQELELQKNKSNRDILLNAIETIKVSSDNQMKNRKYKQFIKAIYWLREENYMKFTFEMY